MKQKREKAFVENHTVKKIADDNRQVKNNIFLN